MGWHGLRVLGDLLGVLLLLAAFGYVAHIDMQTRLAGAPPLGIPLTSSAVSLDTFNTTMPYAAPLPAAPAKTVAPETPKPLSPAETAPPAPPTPSVNPAQRAQYDAVTPKSVIELQQFRRLEAIPIAGANGRKGTATLVNLNPVANSWFLLTLDWQDGRPRIYYHLENPNRASQFLHLSDANGGSLTLTTSGKVIACDLWSGDKPALDAAHATGRAYASLCNQHLYLRNRVAGHYTDLEQMTEFLRDNVWNGDDIIGFVKESIYKDAYREEGQAGKGSAAATPSPDDIPPAAIRPEVAATTILPETFGIAVDGAPHRQMQVGRWYPVRNAPGVSASVLRPGDVSTAILERDKGRVNALDAVEADSLAYFLAFDLSRFEMRYGVGTDHPRVNWSDRAPAEVRVPSLPGPDGIGTISPLVTNGMAGPVGWSRIAATFAGGFKRQHGAFKWGDLSKANFGSHYGFVESGVVLSKLQPGVSTMFTRTDGTFDMKTWTEADNAGLPQVLFARQNGVPLIELAADRKPIAGALVAKWGAGNWSGSADSRIRTLRSGTCLMEANGKRYLVYAYFSSATPSAQAIGFHAYGCSYAMALDMNAPEHTYLSLFTRAGDTIQVQHLVAAMAGVDKNVSGKLVPRFVGYPDNRDFFYLVRRESTK